MNSLPVAENEHFAGVLNATTVGVRCLKALDDLQWMTYRSECITLIGPETVERRIRIDFRPPLADAPLTPPGEHVLPVHVLPLFIFPKQTHAWAFELEDDAGCAMPWPPRPDCVGAGAAGLAELARQAVGEPLELPSVGPTPPLSPVCLSGSCSGRAH